MSNTSIKSSIYSLFVVLLFSISSFTLSARGRVSLFEEANRRYAAHEYAVAADLYIKVFKNKNSTAMEKLTSCINTAQCYYYNHDYSNSLIWYQAAIERGAKDPIYFYKIAECLKMTGKYAEAIVKFEEYKKMRPDDPNTAIMIEGCKLGLEE